ncbi:MAG: FAD-dependent oxidoreductase [Capsulimonadaceae bacterium]|nr:FAD-dependent oxidoreductase [Capsulimonadaceae bacterium]
MEAYGLIVEPSRSIPILEEADVCVLGGSCTGVFAAIRAARLGARVILVERMGCFGGVATLSLVNLWHPPLDAFFDRQIIAGLTTDVMTRLSKRGAVRVKERNVHDFWEFNSAELTIELDEMVREAKTVTPYLHTQFAAPYVGDDERLQGVIVENKSGRGAILAKSFIDATGDGDLCARLGLETYNANQIQPSTTCAFLEGLSRLKGVDLGNLVQEHGAEYGFPQGFVWYAGIPGSDVIMLAGTRVSGGSCADASYLTYAEMEGRRQVRAIQDILRKYAPDTKLTLTTLPARIGIRESRHVRCAYQLTKDDILEGVRFDDAIANGTYPVDIHHSDKPGTTLMYLDGTQRYSCPGRPTEVSRWRPEGSANTPYYQIPLRSMLPQGPYDNIVVAGRMIDADQAAHGAIRVMVNLNQTGEAAGVAAALAVRSQSGNIRAVSVGDVRNELASGGSIVL